MFKRWRVLSIVFALMISLLPLNPILAAGPPATWEAHPPIHVHGHAAAKPVGYTPSQIRAAYGFDKLTSSNGSGQIIAIVDAYDDPTAASDLQTFISQYGLTQMNGLPGHPSCTVAKGPHPCFQKVYAQKSMPRSNSGWALEISLDTQWAHAIAPGADLLLVEASSNSFTNLMGAVDVAVQNNAGVVSMSWGGSEFSTEASYDAHFKVNNVTFTASSGDNGTGVEYPAASPYVVAVGGTTLSLDQSGNVSSETAWSGSGGGISADEDEPGYQSSYVTANGRGVPDVSYDANPSTGVAVYDSTRYSGQSGWFQVGGTSAGAPQWAALIALANQTRSSALSSNSLSSSPEYSAPASNYRDITSGTNGTCGSTCSATTGYDFVTGLGSPRANTLVPYLAGL